jgi:hypothetical protein
MTWKYAAAALLVALSTGAAADEGGVSFWLPGQFGSFVAAPGTPGFSVPVIYFHTSTSGGGDKAFPIGGRVAVGIEARADLVFVAPTYTFGGPVLGGQLGLGVAGAFGNLTVRADATLTGPRGNTIGVQVSDSLTSGADLYPLGTLKWNKGTSNWMTYLMAGVPVGAYTVGQLANTGTNHWSLDAGAGYTYLNPKSGLEISAALGFTCNFENPDTDYRNGLDAHLDFAASQFFSESFHAGLIGYWYQQLGGDSGAGATLGDFKSRVAALGPQAGMKFTVAGNEWYANLKAYFEFAGQNRPTGWNAWLTLVIPLGSAPASSP